MCIYIYIYTYIHTYIHTYIAPASVSGSAYHDHLPADLSTHYTLTNVYPSTNTHACTYMYAVPYTYTCTCARRGTTYKTIDLINGS